MALYRKIEVRMWGDQKFRELSPLPPSGQSLWLYLLVGPFTGPIPGLFKAGKAALADELGWSMEDIDRTSEELSSFNLAKFDWKSKVIWLPNAVKVNPPINPNVVMSWRSEWELLPECELKISAYTAMQETISGCAPSIASAFNVHIKKPRNYPENNTPNHSSNHSTNHSLIDSGNDSTQKKAPEQVAAELIIESAPEPSIGAGLNDSANDSVNHMANQEAGSRNQESATEEKTPLLGKPNDTSGTSPEDVDQKNQKPADSDPLREKAKRILTYLNEKTKSSYQPVESNLSLIMARLKEGHADIIIRKVIDRKCEEWMGSAMEMYLRPITLFNASKFNQYVGQVDRPLPRSDRPIDQHYDNKYSGGPVAQNASDAFAEFFEGGEKA